MFVLFSSVEEILHHLDVFGWCWIYSSSSKKPLPEDCSPGSTGTGRLREVVEVE